MVMCRASASESPGASDRSDGQILSAGFLDLAGVPLREILEEQHGVPVIVDNDAHMAMFGELQIGAARGCLHAVMFTIGTGIGGAVVTDGSIYYGHGIAGTTWAPGGRLLRPTLPVRSARLYRDTQLGCCAPFADR